MRGGFLLDPGFLRRILRVSLSPVTTTLGKEEREATVVS